MTKTRSVIWSFVTFNPDANCNHTDAIPARAWTSKTAAVDASDVNPSLFTRNEDGTWTAEHDELFTVLYPITLEDIV